MNLSPRKTGRQRLPRGEEGMNRLGVGGKQTQTIRCRMDQQPGPTVYTELDSIAYYKPDGKDCICV